MEHKALKYQLKTMISNFPEEMIKPILKQIEHVCKTPFQVNILLKSYKW